MTGVRETALALQARGRAIRVTREGDPLLLTLGRSIVAGVPAPSLAVAWVLAVVAASTSLVAGDEAQLRRLESQLEEVQAELEDLRRRLAGQPRGGGHPADVTSDRGGSARMIEDRDALRWSPVWEGTRVETPGVFRGLRDKPFLLSAWQHVHVGGYTELDYHSFEDGIQAIPEGFRMHRTNLFLYTDLADSVSFASEIEFETEFDGVANSNDIEVALEMAFVDWVLWQELTLRGGVVLPPIGRTNVNHDGPTRELTERPLVSTYVIPTTLSEPGVGAVGVLPLGDHANLEYEIYAVNGFNALEADGDLPVAFTEREQLLRESRTALGGDNNDGVATTGRIGAEFFESFELGGSWHIGTYDERGDNRLDILAGDFAWVASIFSLEGEIAHADFERDTFARTAGVPDRFWGWYVQAGVGGMLDRLPAVAPSIFGGEGSRLGAVLRFDWVDLDGDRGEVIEPGVTFRPIADTIFKLSYRFTRNSFGLRSVPGTRGFDDEGLVFSLSTYF